MQYYELINFLLFLLFFNLILNLKKGIHTFFRTCVLLKYKSGKYYFIIFCNILALNIKRFTLGTEVFFKVNTNTVNLRTKSPHTQQG